MRKRGAAAPSFDPWLSNGQSDVLHYVGANAADLYLTGVPASGNIAGSIAGNILAPVTSPLYRQTVYGAHLGCGFDAATADSFDAAAGVHQVTTGSAAILLVLRFSSLQDSVQICGKFQTGVGGYVIELYGASPNSYLQFRLRGTVSYTHLTLPTICSV